MTKYYLIGVCELDAAGKPKGTHHVSSTQADSIEEAKQWALNDTRCDWGYDPEDLYDHLHILFVMSTPVGVDIQVDEYDERAG